MILHILIFFLRIWFLFWTSSLLNGGWEILLHFIWTLDPLYCCAKSCISQDDTKERMAFNTTYFQFAIWLLQRHQDCPSSFASSRGVIKMSEVSSPRQQRKILPLTKLVDNNSYPVFEKGTFSSISFSNRGIVPVMKLLMHSNLVFWWASKHNELVYFTSTTQRTK